MAQENIRAVMDRLAQQSRARRAAEAASNAAAAPAPADPGLHYAPGDRVLDLATGKRGRIVAGAREPASGVQVFEVALEAGEPVFRTSAELERDRLPRSPQNR